jgi:amino acid adenylation domain-containing protein
MTRDIIDRLEEAVQAHPHAVALEKNGVGISYSDFARQVAAVADRLADAGERVGVCVGKTIDGPVAYMGTLASGRSAVPISPQAPVSRIALMTGAAGLRTILADSTVSDYTAGIWAAEGIAVVRLPCEVGAVTSKPPASAEDAEAYVLFTSGSTGVPKGVCISRNALSAYVDYAAARSSLGPGCRLTNNFDLVFDPSVFDVVACLASGATLVIPHEHEDVNPVRYVSDRRITHWYSVPSVISVARRSGALLADSMPNLVRSSFIGEPLTLDQARAWAYAAPNCVISNVYGPTELTVSCVEHEMPVAVADWPATGNGTVPIGTPYPHLEWCLIDDGVVTQTDGELCMRGSQRLTSYLNPADNAGRFFAVEQGRAVDYDVSAELASLHWYRTGDRIRIENGLMVHLGRLDRQVKVRGFRIELGEVEQHVRALAGVIDAAAVIKDGGLGPSIDVHYCGEYHNPRRIRTVLSSALPAYMIPERFVHVEALPLNDRGKIDYQQLGAEGILP